MARSNGGSDVARYMGSVRAGLVPNVLVGAARAGGKVIAEEAKQRTTSEAVRDDIVVKARAEATHVVATISVRPGWGRSVGIWAEYGTDPHFISVDDSQRDGMSVRRVNTSDRGAALKIGGHFVGKTVPHPGARAIPFLRPALDTRETEAVAAAQRYINAKIGASGVTPTSDAADEL